MQLLFTGLRWLGRLLLVLYFIAVIVILGVRYWLLPNIDQWREPITHMLSAAIGSPVQVNKLEARWDGLLPELTMHGVQVDDQLFIPQLHARFKWQSVWQQQPQFSYLRLDDVELELWRDTQQTLHLTKTDRHADAFIQWLLQQEHIELSNAQLRWQDQTQTQTSQPPPLLIEQVSGHVQVDREQVNFQLQATPQTGLGEAIELRGALTPNRTAPQRVDGTLYVQLNGLSPTAWRQWFDLPSGLQQATVDTQLWLGITENTVQQVTMDNRIYNGVWHNDTLGHISARSLRLFASAPWQAFTQGQPDAFQLEVAGRQLQWQNPELAEPLVFDELALQAQRHAATEEVTIHQLQLSNEDGQAHFHGSWSPQQNDVDIVGDLHQVQIKHLYRYFPTPTISESVVNWLEHSLLSGVAPQAKVRIKGNIDDFPYDQPDSGLFYVGGAFTDGEVDYYQPDPDEKGWPKAENISGQMAIKGSRLWVYADHALLKPDGQNAIAAQQVHIDIDDMDAPEPMLTVQGKTTGDATAYLGLMRHSDLGELLDHNFAETTATGHWQVPLYLQANLEKEVVTQVKGYVHFDRNSVQLSPAIPPISAITGRLYFNENEAATEGMQGQWLAGDIRLAGQVGQPGQQMQLQGNVAPQQLLSSFDLSVLEPWLGGEAVRYEAQLEMDEAQQFVVQGQSDLVGLRSRLPAPLQKDKTQAMPLQFQWRPEADLPAQLTLQLDETLHLQADNNQLSALSWRQPLPDIDPAGLVIDIQEKQLDLDAWLHFKEQIEGAVNNASFTALPPLARMNLQIEELKLWERTLKQFKWQQSEKGEPLIVQVHTPHGELQGSGTWQVDGPQRGINLDATLSSQDIEQLMHDINLKNWLTGQGEVAVQLQWRDFPWSAPQDNIEATFDVALEKGRLDHINSGAAKVFELLSLQSLSRLSRFDLDVTSLIKNGFPFDSIQGELSLNNNTLSTQGFSVVGPAGTIVIDGMTNIDTEALDVDAVVVPNVDMSGASIAAGLALNPIVGVGAFITQLLFKNPVAKAMTTRYKLQGTWEDYQTKELKLEPPEPTSPDAQQEQE